MKQLILDRAQNEDGKNIFINGKNAAYRCMASSLRMECFYRMEIEGNIKYIANSFIDSYTGDYNWYSGRINGYMEVLSKIQKREKYVEKELGIVGKLDFTATEGWIFHSYKLEAPFLWETWEVAKKEIKKLKKIYKNT